MKAEIEIFDDETRTWETQKVEVNSVTDLREAMLFINASPFKEACHIKCEELDIDCSVQSFN